MIHKPFFIAVIFIVGFSLSACSKHQDDDESSATSGLDTRPNNQTCLAPDSITAQPSDVTIEPAFPDLPNMGSVIALLQAPGDDNNWYAVVQDGQVLRFTNNPATSQADPFIDISTQVSCCGERGLLGMAFHPDYPDNPGIYLSYTNSQGTSTISRFTVVNNLWQEDIVI
ncbi:MAG: PQQ-dependent sugar dehydrogenase, partial [Gammaproteobacteria bacterium]|nr:PQQ-dependent sugar dehydrogenase [Gammaproteobacteria bacterium]